jgi:hypothetical protein
VVGRALERDVESDLDAIAPITEMPEGYRWWTFAGGRANTLLARTLEPELGSRCRNSSNDFRDGARKSLAAIRTVIRELEASGRPNQQDAERFAEGAVRERVSKFELCLPERLLRMSVSVQKRWTSTAAPAAWGPSLDGPSRRPCTGRNPITSK